MDVRNIYCVGWNYRLHAQELQNEVPEAPILFTKPTHALVEMQGQTVLLPGERGSVHYEAELVLLIDRAYEPGMSVNDLVRQMALGLDMTLRDKQNDIKRRGQPWLECKGFRNGALISRAIPFPGLKRLGERDFRLLKNGVEVQRGNAAQMVFSPQLLVDYCGNRFGLGAGDILYTGTPVGVGPVMSGDHLALFWGDDLLGECTVQLEGV
ncbi:FAA hydrolase family protein [Heliobacterium undosum]|uniref:FAA hydrolase family protein n=1 Tax=Heliomicrobium undosum TaxID=121734 RepID=A0A845L5S7_9FIRM|nr:fumarylacetoacetate hydrolase family protein [Heliomicrobium undosum]MZP30405.1 FAA hydrolase family protein [Heliomicrobium undosum]